MTNNDKPFWERMESLDKLAEQATPGPWFSLEIDGDACVSLDKEDDGATIIIEPIEKRDADFIASANPATIQAMVAKLRSLERESDYLAEFIALNVKNGCLKFDAGGGHKDYWRDSARRYADCTVENRILTIVSMKD